MGTSTDRSMPANLLHLLPLHLLAILLVFSPNRSILPSAFAQLLPIVASNRTQVYIVHVQHPNGSTVLHSSEAREEWYLSFLPNKTLDSGERRMVQTYSIVISGFAAYLTAEEAEAMQSMDGFLYAHPEAINPLLTTYTPKLLGLDQYDSLWQHSEQGEGVIIGILDSGITPEHPSFADPLGLPQPPLKWHGRCDLPTGSGTCNNKLIGAQQFLIRELFPDPTDRTGHGTHVACIAAGSPVFDANFNGLARGTSTGMAPRAHIAVYKVCAHAGCYDADSLKGIEHAILDGVDVIQISNGQPSEFHESGNIKGSFRAVEKGIITVCAAMNEGPIGSRISNDAPWIVTVGAAATDRRQTAVLRLGNGMEFFGESGYQPDTSGAVNVPLIYPGVPCQNGSLSGFNVTGKIVLCNPGIIVPVEKSGVVKDAGGAGFIIRNHEWFENTLLTLPFVIPGIHVSNNDGLKLVNYISQEKNPTGTITFKGTEIGIRPSPTVSSFSSRGPSLYNGGILKPDVIAPGTNILSAWPFDVSANATTGGPARSDTFSIQYGTSMAAPHVSGIVALLRKSHPNWSPAMIKSALMTTAYTMDRDGHPIIDDASNKRSPANVFAIGAGHVNPSAADDPGLVYDTRVDDYIPYLCGLKGLTQFKVRGIVNRPISCAQKMAAEDLNYPSIQVSLSAGKKNVSIRRTVTNVGEASSSYTAIVTEPKGVKVEVIPNIFQFASVGEEKSFTVEISLTQSPPGRNDVWEGSLKWISAKHKVSSPIVVTA